MNRQSKTRTFNFVIILINIIFVVALFVTEWQYIRLSNNRTRSNNLDSFVNTNVALSNTTNTYLTGESHLCRSWAQHLNNDVGTINEAVEFVKGSIVDKNVMGHVIYKDTWQGYSTRSNVTDETDFSVNYSSLKNDLFDLDKTGMKITPSYINPLNGSRSLAFYTEIKLTDPNDASQQVDGYLLRVVLLQNFKTKWTFPRGSFEHLEVSIIDEQGNYIISDTDFTGNNFFEFYKSYNPSSTSQIDTLKEEVTHNSGYITMKNSYKEDCYIAYSPISSSENWNWTIITYATASDINDVHMNWFVILLLAIGLGALFSFDLVVFLFLSKNLMITAKEAKSASKAKTDFLSTMSHDIRTPMNAIVGLTTIAKEDKNNPASTQDALNKIEQASSHLLTLINDILDISKIESGKLSINPISFSIKELFDTLVNIMHPSVSAKNIKLTYIEHDLKEEWLFADKLRLNQIFTNLFSNAIKYTEPNGSIDIDTYELESDKPNSVKLVYKIKDTGIGMSDEYLTKMYQPFSRATDSRVNNIQGTGLGLAITKQMVDLMGGSIECQSELDKGTTFTVSIDIPIDINKEESKEVNTHEKVDLSGINILVVEDNEINWEVISTLLDMHGISSERAENGKVAVDLVSNKDNENRYDLIFMDIQMPVMNGLDATREIRKLGNNIPIIAMTADAFSENITECLNAGMNGHIAKPIDINIVLNEIKKIKSK